MSNDESQADYVIQVLNSPLDISATDWNALLGTQAHASPFLRLEYLAALHTSGCAVPQTGWTPRFFTLWRKSSHPAAGELRLCAACAVYLKTHSHGEYVFDWAWANAYAEHGLAYYPKALVAVPFTPVPGTRLLADNAHAREALLKALLQWCRDEALSSLHLLFVGEEEVTACEQAGLLLRHNVQFHWKNVAPTLVASRASLPPEGATFPRGGPSEICSTPTLVASRTSLPPEGAIFPRGGPSEICSTAIPRGETGRTFRDFDDFLSVLTQDKRKKIRQERRKVRDAGVTVRWAQGPGIGAQDWDFFYRCYERTYLEHGNAPYLNRQFFQLMADTMPQNWLLFVAERDGAPIASSLIGLSGEPSLPTDTPPANAQPQVAYGRYWGALQRVDCLHFELCYYQPLQWCIEHRVQRFEGGAQGEHKMARALLPVKTTSAHWLAHPAFADAVQQFLNREGQGIDSYLLDLEQRSPLR